MPESEYSHTKYKDTWILCTTYDRTLLIMYLEFTNHCSVQVRGDVEDFVQTQGRIDAFVLFASAKKDRHTNTYRQV